MILKLKHLILLLLAACATAAYAAYDSTTGTYQACVAYQRADNSWSKTYKVHGFIIEGSELYRYALEHGHSSNYLYYKNYYVIPWNEGGYSALELNTFDDNLPTFETRTKDQNGRSWKIQQGTFCL